MVVRDDGRDNLLCLSCFVLCRYIIVILLRLTPYLTFKSEENVIQINDSESSNVDI